MTSARRQVPERIRVAGQVYKVILSSDELKLRGHPSVWGACFYGSSVIALDPDLEPGFMRVVLWHEVKHAIYTLSGVQDPTDTEDDKNELTEEQAIAQSAALEIAVLRDNPLLVQFLLAGGEWDDDDSASGDVRTTP